MGRNWCREHLLELTVDKGHAAASRLKIKRYIDFETAELSLPLFLSPMAAGSINTPT